jgi:hypothetical protein
MDFETIDGYPHNGNIGLIISLVTEYKLKSMIHKPTNRYNIIKDVSYNA